MIIDYSVIRDVWSRQRGEREGAVGSIVKVVATARPTVGSSSPVGTT